MVTGAGEAFASTGSLMLPIRAKTFSATMEDACARYSLSLDEFLLWKRAVKTAGVSGLKIKRVQDHRCRRAEGPVRKRW